MSNCILESLASGTPTVTTMYNSFYADKDSRVYREVRPTDLEQINKAVMDLIHTKPGPDLCRQMIRHLTWEMVPGGAGLCESAGPSDIGSSFHCDDRRSLLRYRAAFCRRFLFAVGQRICG